MQQCGVKSVRSIAATATKIFMTLFEMRKNVLLSCMYPFVRLFIMDTRSRCLGYVNGWYDDT